MAFNHCDAALKNCVHNVTVHHTVHCPVVNIVFKISLVSENELNNILASSFYGARLWISELPALHLFALTTLTAVVVSNRNVVLTGAVVGI